jgi:hypothetical protein
MLSSSITHAEVITDTHADVLHRYEDPAVHQVSIEVTGGAHELRMLVSWSTHTE